MTRVLFAGLGSVGARCAESVVRTTLDPHEGLRLSGVTLLDRDVLEPQNLVRHVALPHEVGLRKTELVRRRLAALAPALPVETVDASVFDDSVDAAVAKVDVVAASFDNPPALFKLNALCVKHRKPLLVAEVISGGIGVWLLAANLGERAPCLLDIARARGEDVPVAAVDEVAGADPGAIDYADPHAPQAQARVPADDWSCGVAASLLARAVVQTIRDGRSAAPPIQLLALQHVPDPQIAAFFRFPLQLTVVPAQQLLGCPECHVREVTAAEHERDLAFFAPSSSEEVV